MPSIHDRLLMHRRGPSLLASDEPGTHPDSLSSPSQVCRQTPAIIYRPSTDDQDGFTGEGRFLPFDCVHDGRDQDRSGHVTGVSAALASLSADEIYTNFEGLGDMLGVTDHLVRVESPFSRGILVT